MPRGKKDLAESISQTVTGRGRSTTVLKAAEKIEPAPDVKVPTQNPEKLSLANLRSYWGRLGGPAAPGAMLSTGLASVSRSAGWLATSYWLPPWR